MLTREGLQFILRITDFFHGHWEDPGWGQRAANQVLLLAATQTLAGGIADTESRRLVQGALEKATTEAAQKVGRAATAA